MPRLTRQSSLKPAMMAFATVLAMQSVHVRAESDSGSVSVPAPPPQPIASYDKKADYRPDCDYRGANLYYGDVEASVGEKPITPELIQKYTDEKNQNALNVIQACQIFRDNLAAKRCISPTRETVPISALFRNRIKPLDWKEVDLSKPEEFDNFTRIFGKDISDIFLTLNQPPEMQQRDIDGAISYIVDSYKFLPEADEVKKCYTGEDMVIRAKENNVDLLKCNYIKTEIAQIDLDNDGVLDNLVKINTLGLADLPSKIGKSGYISRGINIVFPEGIKDKINKNMLWSFPENPAALNNVLYKPHEIVIINQMTYFLHFKNYDIERYEEISNLPKGVQRAYYRLTDTASTLNYSDVPRCVVTFDYSYMLEPD